MRRNLYIYVALALTAAPVLSQGTGTDEDQASRTSTTPATQPAQRSRWTAPTQLAPDATEQLQTGPTQPQTPGAQAERTLPSVPASRYSPMAAQGGYTRFRTPPWETFWTVVVHELNPRDSNLGLTWEQWRQSWVENAATNRYFWYAFWTTLILILSWFALAWIQLDRVRETSELAEFASDALRYSEYSKRQAKQAIGRYNEHIEKCNRVIEAARSGLVTPETATLDNYKRELVTLRNDNGALKLENENLKAQLESKTAELQSLTARIADVEKHIQTGNSKSANPQLVERIRRLEEQNRLLQQKANSKTTTVAVDKPAGEVERC